MAITVVDHLNNLLKLLVKNKKIKTKQSKNSINGGFG